MRTSKLTLVLPLCLLAVSACAQTALRPSSMKKIADVDPRFVSYNIEAVEVTGGRFWKPYSSTPEASAKKGNGGIAGLSPDLFQQRGPIDLSSPKLRTLAAALGPSYLRVSGTWRNATLFQDNNQPAPATPPKGYDGVMTRSQWKGVIDFARAVNAELVASVATSMGTRDAKGAWTPVEAKAFFDATKQLGGRIVATEFANEPTFPGGIKAPEGYGEKQYGAEAKAFGQWLKANQPGTLYLGPGSVGEGIDITGGAASPMKISMWSTPDLMRASGPVYDVFSYHFYNSASKRCLGPAAAKEDVALTSAWFARNTQVYDFYAKIRDDFQPGRDMWLTETGEAGCGGDPWSGQFADTFRYVNQLGSLAQRGVKTVMQNTLAASDYAFLDPGTLDPRPNYWAAVLWKRMMGTRVLDPGVAPSDTLYVYAGCMRDGKGGVTLAVVNTAKESGVTLSVPVAAEVYSLTSPALFSSAVMLNGKELKAGADGTLPVMAPAAVKKGALTLPALSVSFLALRKAGNSACRG